MRRAEFLKRLNRRAINRYGLKRITDGILGDWLEAGVVIAPRKEGRARRWSGRQYRMALEVVRLKSQGVRSLAFIRSLLWLKRYEVPLFDPRFELESREALAREFVQIRNTLIGRIHSTYPIDYSGKNTDWRKRSIVEKMGPLDPSLQPFVQYQPDELIDAYTRLRFDQGSGQLDGAAQRLIDQIIPAIFQRSAPNLPLPILNKPHKVSGILGGLLGKRDEVENPELSIAGVTEEQFREARLAVNQSISIFRKIGLEKVAISLTLSWKWRISMFVFFLDLIHRQRLNSIEQAFDKPKKTNNTSNLGPLAL